MENIIELKGVSKIYKTGEKEFKALDNINLNITKGEFVVVLGPSGAGKSTLLNIIGGMDKVTSGEIIVNGMDPVNDRKEYVKEIGVVFGQKSQLWWDIPAIDSFDLLRDIYEIPEDEYIKTRDELVSLLKLEEIIKLPVRQLSLGERMKCELVASLLHNPKILFLDEPTIGLDAVSKVVVRDFIKKINKEKKVTVILTTHDMADIESLVKRIIIIGNGKKLYDGDINNIKKKYSSEKIVEIYYDNLKEIPKIKDSVVISNDNGIIKLRIDSKKISVSAVTMEYAKVCEIKDINVITETIDNIIYKIYKDYKL